VNIWLVCILNTATLIIRAKHFYLFTFKVIQIMSFRLQPTNHLAILLCTILVLVTSGCEDSAQHATEREQSHAIASTLEGVAPTFSTSAASSPGTTTPKRTGSVIGMNNNPESNQIVKGMQAYKDPITGQFTSKPTSEDTQGEGSTISTLSTSSARNMATPISFDERPSDVEGGGMVIDLKGQFSTN